MITIRTKSLLLCACFIEAAWLLVAQTLNLAVILLPCLVCFLVLVGWSAIKNMAMPVMLFFLPFSPLLKIRPGTISFFTLGLLMIYAIYTVTGSRQVKVLHLVPAMLLVVLTLIVKAAYNYDIDNPYIMFAVTLMLVPFLSRELEEEYDFYWLTICFVLGVCLAAITASYLTRFPTVSRYIDINTTLGFTRRSGYMGDPNFYSSHITAALSGLLVLLLNNTKRSRLFVMIPLICLLLYCGLMSVSKSFSLICVCLLLLWVLALLLQKGRMSVKVTLIITLAVAGLFLLSSTMFTDLLDLVFARFNRDSNLSDFTTGRTDVWDHYVRTMLEDVRLLLFGQGYTDVIFGEKPTHNTLLQGVFQFGIIGFVLITAWMVCFVMTLLGKANVHRHQLTHLVILLIGVFGPWMALDYVFFDEFFLFPVYVCMAVRFLHQQYAAESALLYE